MANLTTTDAQFVVNDGATIPRSGSNARKNGPEEVRILCQNAVITLNYKTDTIEGNSFSTQQEFFDEILSLFTNGGGSGTGAVESVTGDLVDDSDPSNPVIDLPSDVLRDSDTSNVSAADKVVRYSNIGAVNTATPQFPENAVPLSLLDVRVPTGGTASNFLAGDNTWKTPANTTYAVIAEAEATTGTASTARAVSAASQKRDILNRTAKYDAVIEVNASRTLALTDASRNKILVTTGGSALDLTVPPTSSVAWVVGDSINIANANGAILTITAGSGVNIISIDDFITVSPKGRVKLEYVNANAWMLSGDLISAV